MNRWLFVGACWSFAAWTTIGGQAKSSDTCASQKFATVALGEALGHVRAARLFAEPTARRLALAELETAIVEQIEMEADSNFRGAAWRIVDGKVAVESASRSIRRIESFGVKYASQDSLVKAYRATEFTRGYREALEEVVRLVDPRSPKRCASDRWRRLHALALKAEAL